MNSKWDILTLRPVEKIENKLILKILITIYIVADKTGGLTLKNIFCF